MRTNMKGAMDMARRNKLTYGGEWRVWKVGKNLWIQMTTDRQPHPDALVIYTTADEGRGSGGG